MNLTKTQRAYFNAAKAVAETSTFKRVKIGCIITYKHKIISSGANSYKTSPLMKKYNKYRFENDAGMHCVHAEINALSPLIGRKDIDFSHVSLYVYRQYQTGELAMARSCESCMALIRSLKIRHLYYTGPNSYIAEELIY